MLLNDFDSNASWTSLWSSYIMCDCRAIRPTRGPCPNCGKSLDNEPSRRSITLDDCTNIEVAVAHQGAEGRYEDYVFLRLMEREWRRPLADETYEKCLLDATPPHAALVIVFWIYFETRIERLFREAARSLPGDVGEFILTSHSSIGSRLYRLATLLFVSLPHFRGRFNYAA